MGASITLAGESLIAQKQGTKQILEVNRFVLAHIPGLDTTQPIDRTAGLPPADQIVHVKEVTQQGYLGPNQVVYSLMLGSDIGDFDFNYIGLKTVEDVLLIAAYVPRQQKRREIPPQQSGNNLTRNIVLEYDGAQSLTGITVPASTWQFDFTTQFAAIDSRLNQMQAELDKKVDLATWTPPQAVSLDGPELVYPGSTNIYKITDFNRFSIFTVMSSIGTATIQGDEVHLVIDAAAPASVITLEVSRDDAMTSFRIPLGSAAIIAPTIISPANQAMDVTLDPVITASAFEVYPKGHDTHVSRRWEIATDAAFANVIFDKTSTTALSSIRPSDYGVTLQPGKRHYVRATDTGATLQSAVGTASTFNTATIYIRRPSISSPIDGAANVSLSASIIGDDFSVSGGADIHVSSRWQISVEPDFSSLAIDSGWNTSQLTKYVLVNQLSQATQYYVRVKYKGATLGESEWSVVVAFFTANNLTGVYTQKNGGGSLRSEHNAVAVDGKMYVTGGVKASAGSSSSWLNDILEYNPGTGTWRTLTSNYTLYRKDFAMAAVGRKIFGFGGYSQSSAGALDNGFIYNIDTNTFTAIPAKAGVTNFIGSAAAVVGGVIYIFGGGQGSGDTSPKSTLWTYTPGTGVFAQKASAPTAMRPEVFVECNGLLYAMLQNVLQIYNPNTDTWSLGTVYPGGNILATTAVSIDTKIYLYSGYPYPGTNQLWMYDTELDTWSQLASGGTARLQASAVAIDRVMYVYGGSLSINYFNDLWAIS